MNNAPNKAFKTYAFMNVFLKIDKNCNLYGLVRIWSNFDHSKVPNYDLVKVNKERF
jgi:hypothetical protein